MPVRVSQDKQTKVKAVLFAPYTSGSVLAQELRKAEEKMEELTGYRLKVMERAGQKLSDLLVKSNPWKGLDCWREKCLLCVTKDNSGKNKSQDCCKRSVVYEMWCQCLEKEEEKLRERIEDDEEYEREKQKIKVWKYIGESSRSTYERAYEHQYGLKNLSTNSYMLKHGIDCHEETATEVGRFHIKVLMFARSSFDRQIQESVFLQENRHHNLLNSKSEYNRCALPRLATKIGDNLYKKWEEEDKEEKRKEELIQSKIRRLRKTMNSERWRDREEESEEEEDPEMEKWRQPKRMRLEEMEIRVEDDNDDPDWIEKIRKQEEILKETLVKEGKEENWMNMNQKFKEHRAKIEKMEKEKEDRINLAERKTQSWELLRLCRKEIKENSSIWKERKLEREEERNKLERLQKAKMKKKVFREKQLENKLMKSWLQLPEKEKIKYREKEEKERRLEFQETKQNLYRWRQREGTMKTNKGKKKNRETTTEEKIENIQEILERIREEDKMRRLEREKLAAERRQRQEEIRNEKMKREEQVKLAAEKRRERIEKRIRLEKRFETIRWVTSFIEENQEKWEKEKIERDLERERKLQEWEKNKIDKVKNVQTPTWTWENWRRGEEVLSGEDRETETKSEDLTQERFLEVKISESKIRLKDDEGGTAEQMTNHSNYRNRDAEADPLIPLVGARCGETEAEDLPDLSAEF